MKLFKKLEFLFKSIMENVTLHTIFWKWQLYPRKLNLVANETQHTTMTHSIHTQVSDLDLPRVDDQATVFQKWLCSQSWPKTSKAWKVDNILNKHVTTTNKTKKITKDYGEIIMSWLSSTSHEWRSNHH